MKNYIIVSEKSWNLILIERLSKQTKYNWILISSKDEFNFENLKKINPEKIFIPHWSHIIPLNIFNFFECIVFHMTDLPFGRGGSPLQNLILLGLKKTKISALKVNKFVDSGDIYLKKELSLNGKAQQIYKRANDVIFKMILEIVKENPLPKKQQGEPTFFKRRKPYMSNIKNLNNLEKAYDFIRMLDADGYPRAFLETDFFRFEFSDAELNDDKNNIKANVRIIKK